MPPQTRKRRPEGSYAEGVDDDYYQNVLDGIWVGISPGCDAMDLDYASDHPPKRARTNKDNAHKTSMTEAELSDREEDDLDRMRPDLIDKNCETQHEPQYLTSIELQLSSHIRDTNVSFNLKDVLDPKLGHRPIVKIAADGTVITLADPKSRPKSGFERLPVELLTRILRPLLVTTEPIQFGNRIGFQHSAQILRTSRAVHDEGTRLLYGKHCFVFERCNATRGTYYEEQWQEVGWKDVRRFLHDIGDNKSKLKFVAFRFSDALYNMTRHLHWRDRKYVNDAVLFQCFGMIASHAVLEKFVIAVCGRPITKSNTEFLKALSQIKCHEMGISKDSEYSKIRPSVAGPLFKMMLVLDPSRTPKRTPGPAMPFQASMKSARR